MTVTGGVPALSVGLSLPNAVAGQPYSGSVSVSGGVPPYQINLKGGGLPPGLSLDSSSGAITGTVAADATPGIYHFMITVTDSVGFSEDILFSSSGITVLNPDGTTSGLGCIVGC
jgi:hypothetical protein